MDKTTYDRYKDALDAAKSMDNKELVDQIKAQVIATHGTKDDDVDTLFKYHG